MPGNTLDKPSYFTWKGINIRQGPNVFKIGTDALLLGNWVSSLLENASSVLDAGTGTGILALMMARHFTKAKIIAWDITDEAIQLAQFNISESDWQERIFVEKKNVLDTLISEEGHFDLILSNPPFYSTNNLPRDEYMALAKHNAVRIQDWMNSFIEKLNQTGHLFIIVPAEATMEWIAAANKKDYYNRNRLNVFSYASDPEAKRSLLHFTSELNQPLISELVIYATPHTYTPEYLKFTGIQSSKSKAS